MVPRDEDGSITNSRPFHRITIFGLLKFQLVIAPLFLSPFYHQIGQTHKWFVMFLAIAVVPIGYSALLSWFAVTKVSDSSKVYFGIRRGAAYGALFCILALGPIAVWSEFGFGHDPPMTLFFPCIVFSYVIFGATGGGIVGLIADISSPNKAGLP